MKLPLERGRKHVAPAGRVTIEGDLVRAILPEGSEASMKLEELFERASPGVPDSASVILPDGVKCSLPTPNGCILVHQTPPRVYSFHWIAADSDAEYGPEASYRQVRLALPYLIVLAIFERARGGIPRLSQRNECFFLSQPLDRRGLDTQLCYPALLNCSKFPDHPQHPVAWICTQNLPYRELSQLPTLEQSLRVGLEALLRHLLESGFNRSSEHHELNSWFSETVAAGVDPRVANVEAWERATAADPLFVLDVPWLPTGMSLQAVAERIAAVGHPAARRPETAEDVVRIIENASNRKRRSA
jgi:hypothetical protein